MKIAFSILPILLFGMMAQAGETNHAHRSQYAGQETRTIKSLSLDDIAELRRGGGWGLARAAELNGVPGPAHLLELKDEIPLKVDQVSAIERIYKNMKARAIQQGERLIAAEQQLERLFREGSITPDGLRSSLKKSAAIRMALRLTHLATHLETPGILSHEQIMKYNALRGYSK